jgi:hypothetical protein
MSSKRTDCAAKATTCREQARKDPQRHEHWTRVAEQWERIAHEPGERSATTHEIHRGRMIPKPAKP